MAEQDERRRLSRRERIALHLVLIALWILKPWRFDHQAKEHFEGIRDELKRTDLED